MDSMVQIVLFHTKHVFERPNEDDQGVNGYVFIKPIYVEYDWKLSISDQRIIQKPKAVFTWYDQKGTIILTSKRIFTMNSLITTCFDRLKLML